MTNLDLDPDLEHERRRLDRDLAYVHAVARWALEHLDRADLAHAQRRAVERELRGALRLRELILARRRTGAIGAA